jgi:hypothetical protein
MLTILHENPQMTEPPPIGRSVPGHKLLLKVLNGTDRESAGALCSTMEQYSEFELLFNVVDNRSQCDPFLAACLKIFAESESYASIFTPPITVSRWKQIQNIFDENDGEPLFRDLIARLMDKQDLCNTIQNLAEGFRRSDVPLYSLIIDQATAQRPEFCEWCRAGLQALDKPSWTLDLSGDCSSIRFACQLTDAGIKLIFTTPFSDALVEHAKNLVKGEQIPEDEVLNQWPKVLSCLDTSLIGSLTSDLLSVAIDSDGNASKEFFNLYGDRIADSSVLLSAPTNVDRLMSPIVKERNDAGLNWFVDLLEKDSELSNKIASEADISGLRTRLKDNLSDPKDDSAQSLIDKLARLLGIVSEPTEGNPQ